MILYWAFAIALTWSWLSVAAAQHGATAPEPVSRVVALDSDQCDVIAYGELHQLIALELAPRTVRSIEHAYDSPALTRARVTCSDTQAHLVVEDTLRGRREELSLDLRQIARAARPRLLALSLSELIATVDMEAAPRAAGVAPTRKDTAVRRNDEAAVRASRVWLGAGLAREGRPAMRSVSMQTGFTAALARWPVALHGALALQRGERAVSAGDVVAWTASGTAGIGGQLALAWVELTLGLGLRLGYARLHGDAARSAAVAGRTVSGLWWGPTAFVGAVLPAHTRWGVRCGVDLGYVAKDVRGFDGAGGGAASVEGFQLQATLGLSIRVGKQRRPSE